MFGRGHVPGRARRDGRLHAVQGKGVSGAQVSTRDAREGGADTKATRKERLITMSFGHKLRLGAIASVSVPDGASSRSSSLDKSQFAFSASGRSRGFSDLFLPRHEPRRSRSLADRARASVDRRGDVYLHGSPDREALRRAAKRGVLVRVYRDREQYERELRRDSTVPTLLAGEPHIHVKVKNGRELMHEKAMLCDDSVLRSGSGNWSVSAARYQDNEVSVTTDPSSVSAFSRDFREMWERSDNMQVR